MNKTSSFHEVAETLAKAVKFGTTGGTGRVRIFDIVGKKMKIYSTGETIREVNVTDLYAEEIPADELQLDESTDKIINCFHFQKDIARTHGVPFRFVLKPVRSCPRAVHDDSKASEQGETFEKTKERLQLRMGMGEKEFARCKFNLTQPSTYSKPSPINDGEYSCAKARDIVLNSSCRGRASGTQVAR